MVPEYQPRTMFVTSHRIQPTEYAEEGSFIVCVTGLLFHVTVGVQHFNFQIRPTNKRVKIELDRLHRLPRLRVALVVL